MKNIYIKCTGVGNGNGGCGAELEITLNPMEYNNICERLERKELYLTHRLDFTEFTVTIKCSECGTETNINENKIPKRVLDLLKADDIDKSRKRHLRKLETVLIDIVGCLYYGGFKRTPNKDIWLEMLKDLEMWPKDEDDYCKLIKRFRDPVYGQLMENVAIKYNLDQACKARDENFNCDGGDIIVELSEEEKQKYFDYNEANYIMAKEIQLFCNKLFTKYENFGNEELLDLIADLEHYGAS